MNELIERTNVYNLPLIMREVRQGDSFSPKLFTATLEYVFRKISCNSYGYCINGNQLTNLRFADYIVLIAKSEGELEAMKNDLDRHFCRNGFKMNPLETRVLAHTPVTIRLKGTIIVQVQSYVYLGQIISLPRNHSKEISLGIQAGWQIFHQYKDSCFKDSVNEVKAETI
ncbi:unnamed protein product [Cylicostephanus goldi]|uniref:Reverse transcriptase domain-containing protein n=1 Tax=Cylicostephanus goldi TaxID=71465 RepID=A0A3P7M5F4_CYLGO|nr:unnamed protein product [Cylicostephanus goldi]